VAVRPFDVHPIAKVSLSQIVGLAEAVDERGGEADVAVISEEVDMDVDRLGPIVNAAEFLGMMSVDGGNLRLTDLSRKVLGASVRGRKAIFREIVKEVPVFRHVVERTREAGRALSRREVLEAIAARVGSHAAEDVFQAFVYWGRYCELVSYDSRSELLSLRGPG
jgi:hypothetical protein